ncbi:MAG: CDGSH iron-sulfur domain-containing protein [Gemmatimonadetes bacterium]|nr:CDGSH iron-sulfur domain-containing protein [Gemmatimonadota bacterium]
MSDATGSPAPSAAAAATGVVIKVRKNGSLLVTGEFQLIDHEGREIARPVGKPNVSLCRCGHSARKPFCDSAHKACGFVDPPDAPVASPTPVPDGTTP